MVLTQEQIEKLLKNLSKVGVENTQKLTKDINNIVGYMKILDEVDTKYVIPTISVLEKENILRKDEETINEIDSKDLLKCSPQKIINNQISISNIMN